MLSPAGSPSSIPGAALLLRVVGLTGTTCQGNCAESSEALKWPCRECLEM